MAPVRRPVENFQMALEDLLARCEERSIDVQLYLVGGAALALGHSARTMITDVDAVIRCRTDITQLIAEVGKDHGLEFNWLNNGAQGFVSPVVDDPAPVEVLSAAGSRVTAASVRVLAAMKIRAGRPQIDRADLKYLLEELDITEESEALDLYDWYFPEDQLRQSALEVLRAVLRERRSEGGMGAQERD